MKYLLKDWGLKNIFMPDGMSFPHCIWTKGMGKHGMYHSPMGEIEYVLITHVYSLLLSYCTWKNYNWLFSPLVQVLPKDLNADHLKKSTTLSERSKDLCVCSSRYVAACTVLILPNAKLHFILSVVTTNFTWLHKIDSELLAWAMVIHIIESI